MAGYVMNGPVGSNTVVNLNADLLDGNHASAFAPSGFGIGTQAQILNSGTDLNTIRNTGFYKINAAVNAPPRVSGDNPSIWHYVIVTSHDTGSWCSQVAIEYSTGTVFSRVQNSGTWQAWVRQWSTTADTLFTSGGISVGGDITLPNANAIIFSKGTAESLASSTPTGLTYGKLQGWGDITIAADTDNGGTEHVILAAGHGVTPATTDGLAVGQSTLQWQGNNVIHSGGGQTINGTLTATTFSGALSGNATTATNVAWTGVTGKPTTLSGYGITDAIGILGNGSQTWTGTNSFTAETHFSSGTYSDPRSGVGQAIKASGGIATDTLYASGAGTFANISTAGGQNRININGAQIGTVSGTDVIFTNVKQLRFSDSTTWDWNQWAGIGYDSTNHVLHIGGPQGSWFTANSSPPAISVSFDGVTTVSSPSYTSTVATGTAPLVVSSTTAVTNLNADMLDGQHASAFAPSGYGLGGVSNRLNSGTDLNTIKNAGWYDVQNPANGVSGQTWHNVLVIPSADQNYVTQMVFPMTENYSGMWIRTEHSGTWDAWRTVWNSANDGSGSGLDADLLDGIDSTGFAQSAAKGSADLNTLTQSGMYRFDTGNANVPGGIVYGQLLVVHGGADTIFQICTDYASGSMYWRSGNPVGNSGGTWGAWRKIWHDGNFNPINFANVAVSGQTEVSATIANDTLTLAAGSNITLTTSGKTVTIASTASGGGTSNYNPLTTPSAWLLH